MATEAQIEANRENAKKSTGPRTDDGKARVRRNAARHGLCQVIPLMSDENAEDFKEMLVQLYEEHRPQGETEGLLVYKMAVNFLSSWRANILLTERLDINDTRDDSKQVALMLRYFNTADRAFNRNLADLRKLQKERQNEQIGSVPQMIFAPPPKPPEAPQKEDTNPYESLLDPDIEPLISTPAWKSTGEPPKKAA